MTETMLNPRHITRTACPAVETGTPLRRAACDLEVIIPSLNEEERLPRTLSEVLRELRTLDGLVTRVVIVDNGSSDRTADVVDRFRAADGPEVVVIGCGVRGKGAAVRRGVLTSQARMIGFLDADLSVPAHSLHDAVARLQSGQDVVIASRRADGASYEVMQPRFRRIGSWAFRAMITTLVPGVTDSQCGFKFFSSRAARRIFTDMDVTGFAFDVEVLMRAHRAGYAVAELPVAWSDDSASTLGLVSHAPEIARDVVRLHRLDAALSRRSRFAPHREVMLESSEMLALSEAFRALHEAVDSVDAIDSVVAIDSIVAIDSVVTGDAVNAIHADDTIHLDDRRSLRIVA